jgi:signal transduction histidine kinase
LFSFEKIPKKNSSINDNIYGKSPLKGRNNGLSRKADFINLAAVDMHNIDEFPINYRSSEQMPLPQNNIRFLHKILNSIDLGLIISDNNGDFVYWNKTVLDQLDLSVSDLTNKNIFDLIEYIQTNSSLEANINTSLTSLVYSEEKILNTVIKFSSKQLALRTYPLSSAQNIYRQWIFWDVSTKFETGKFSEVLTTEDEIQLYKQKAAVLAEINSQLEKSVDTLSKEKNEREILLSIISHDLKSPFQGLLGTFSALNTCFDELPKEEIKTYMTYAQSSVKRLYSLVDGLLEWSRLILGQVKFQQTQCNLHYTLLGVINQLKIQLEEKQISVINQMEENLETLADENMVTSIFRNLISNAIKYSKRNGKITLSSEVKNGFISITIADEGIGMSETVKESIFKPSLHSTTRGTEEEEGSGFGLLLCKEMMEWHNGSISFESELGKGTSFKLNFPLISL